MSSPPLSATSRAAQWSRKVAVGFGNETTVDLLLVFGFFLQPGVLIVTDTVLLSTQMH